MRSFRPASCILLALCATLLACNEQAQHGPATLRQSPCYNMASFRDLVLREASGPQRAKLSHWMPPQPVPRTLRADIEPLAVRYAKLCGPQQTLALAQELMRFRTDATGWTGPQGIASLEKFLREWARSSALEWQTFEQGAVWELSLGHGSHALTFWSHVDVTPPSTPAVAASRDIFVPTVIDEKLWGVGAQASKGPIAATLVAMRTLGLMGLLPPSRISIALSAAGENNWAALQNFARASQQAHNNVAFDGRFPVGAYESGFVGWSLAAPMAAKKKTRLPVLRSVHAGSGFLTLAAAAQAELDLSAVSRVPDVRKKLDAACARETARFGGSACTVTAAADNKALQLSLRGQSAASSEPAAGKNALLSLARVTHAIKVAPNGAAALLEAVAAHMTDDAGGRHLGLYYGDNVMGDLVVVPASLHSVGDQARLDVSMYRPRGVKPERFKRLLDDAEQLLRSRIDKRIRAAAPPLLSEPWQSRAPQPLLDALLQSYLRGTQGMRLQNLPPPRLQNVPHSTFARLFGEGLSFGPVLPGALWLAHSSDENIPLWQLGLLNAIYLDAIMHLQNT